MSQYDGISIFAISHTLHNIEGSIFLYRFFVSAEGVNSMDTPDYDCIGNADTTLQMQGCTFCVYPTSHSMMSEMPIPSMKQKLTVMQIAEFFRNGGVC